MSTLPTADGLQDTAGRRSVTAHETVFEGAVWDVVADRIAFADGVSFRREYQRHTGAVAVLALDAEDRILLIRQYRHPAGMTFWEIPAGLLDIGGEPPHRAALRELVEETGQEAGSLRVLLDVFPSPGGSDEAIRIYLAHDVTPVAGDEYVRTDEEAEIEVSWFPLAEAIDAVLAGRLQNGTAAAGILALAALRARGQGTEDLRVADAPWDTAPRLRGLT